MEELLKFLMENDGIIAWTEVPLRFSSVIFKACRDDLIRSFCETESYQITEKGRQIALSFSQRQINGESLDE